jgi:cell division protease FtsH
MVGPPGTGKTLIARAVAGEADVPFFSVAGSSFVELFVGVGAARVRDLFSEARKRAPVIIFIDELDALGQRRAGSGAIVSNDEREHTLNQLLTEMDGFDPTEGIVVLAATNRPEVLDPALLRPGRFDRQITIPLPNLTEREAILKVHCRDKKLDPDVDLRVVARGTPGFSGADLANLVNEAAINAVRDEREVITAADFDAARDRIILGRREGSNVLLPEEKQAVAFHEAGHALVAALSPRADPVAKVTILPAGQALGVTQQLPLVERHLYGEDYLTQTLAVRLGGRAAELVEFWARARPARPTTWPRRPTSPSRWSASSGCPRPSARSAIPRAGRCSSAPAGQGCPAAPTPRPPRRSSTPRSPGCFARPRSRRSACSGRTSPSCGAWWACCWSRRRWTATRSTGCSA